ncbi:MAG: hypothetical protein GY822_27300 [Deltaproteobacteria bacterium]|nr:hypothetical protein [Deltaproteobacteria bacterium]
MEHLQSELRGCAPLLPAMGDSAVLFDLVNGEVIFEHHPLAVRQQPIMVGSVFKLLATYSLLVDDKTQFLSSKRPLQYTCNGTPVSKNGIERPCWLHAGHGKMTLGTALLNSCNAFFYEASSTVTSTAYLESLRLFGLSQKVLLRGGPCADNILPASISETSFPDAFIGDHASLRITPASLLDVVARISGYPIGGKGDVLDDDALYIIRNGMSRVSQVGTLANTFGDPSIAAKTGTSRRAGRSGTRGVVAGFLPLESPRFAFVVVKDEGRGAKDAGPVAKVISNAVQNELRTRDL